LPIYKYRREEPLSREEIQNMIENVHDLAVKALIVFLYLYGTRISEALKLLRSDFWIEGKYLAVKIPISKKRKSAGPTVPSHILRVSLDAPFMNILLEYLEIKKNHEKLWEFNRVKVWRIIKKLNPNCSPHFFRHSRLRKLAEKGATEMVLMDWAGWSDPRPAGKYIVATGRFAKKYADKID